MNRGQSEASLELLLAGGVSTFGSATEVWSTHTVLWKLFHLWVYKLHFFFRKKGAWAWRSARQLIWKRTTTAHHISHTKVGHVGLYICHMSCSLSRTFFVFLNLNLQGHGWASLTSFQQRICQMSVCIYNSGTKRAAGSSCSVLEN